MIQQSKRIDRGIVFNTRPHTAKTPDTAMNSMTSHAPIETIELKGVKRTNQTRSGAPRSIQRKMAAKIAQQGATKNPLCICLSKACEAVVFFTVSYKPHEAAMKKQPLPNPAKKRYHTIYELKIGMLSCVPRYPRFRVIFPVCNAVHLQCFDPAVCIAACRVLAIVSPLS